MSFKLIYSVAKIGLSLGGSMHLYWKLDTFSREILGAPRRRYAPLLGAGNIFWQKPRGTSETHNRENVFKQHTGNSSTWVYVFLEI